MRDMRSNFAVEQSLAPAARTASANGATVDLKGFDSATFIVSTGAVTDGEHVFSAEDSEDDSTWSAVAAADLIGSFPTLNDASESPTVLNDNAAFRVGYRGGKRYVRPVVTVTGSPSTGAIAGVDVVKGHPHLAPPA